ncbi:MAG: glycosyltransferase, partial [Brevundimonas sp.]
QRTRWLKGYMQTLAVHLFKRGLGIKGFWAILTTLIAGLMAASIHGYALAAIAIIGLLGILSLDMPQLGISAFAVMITGYSASWLTCWVGTRRIGLRYGIVEIALAPLYWGLLTLAFFHALLRLIFQPHTWDKTPHLPDVPVADLHTPVIRPRYSSAAAGREVA